MKWLIYLLQDGSNCVGVFQNGQTFLMEACKTGNTQIVELLLDQEDVNIHAVDNVGCLSIL